MDDIKALKVHQWLQEWDKVPFDVTTHRKQPEKHFYVFSMPASSLKKLSGIYRRTLKAGELRSKDLGIQRRHDPKRSTEIADFIRYGGPFSELSQTKRDGREFDSLRKPGWLPTAIVLNVLTKEDEREGLRVAESDLIKIDALDKELVSVKLPKNFSKGNWVPEQIYPIEVIDGQHRLWAFEDDIDDDYHLPVVAFHGLDISWQAYLFWTINIKPKRINASLAFDLYPLLRAEDWLEKFEGHSIYRETRAQEIVELLWSSRESPWYQRINMLGDTGLKMVSQAAWVRSLIATFVKNWQSSQIGGLFGAKKGGDTVVLKWSGIQQASFLICSWGLLYQEVKKSTAVWAEKLRKGKQADLFEDGLDLAFVSQYSLLNTDQGVRGVLHVVNDLCFVLADNLELKKWVVSDVISTNSVDSVSSVIESLRKESWYSFLQKVNKALADYDWRTSSAPGLTEDKRIFKAALRGSGGYRMLRISLLEHLSKSDDELGKAAERVLSVISSEAF